MHCKLLYFVLYFRIDTPFSNKPGQSSQLERLVETVQVQKKKRNRKKKPSNPMNDEMLTLSAVEGELSSVLGGLGLSCPTVLNTVSIDVVCGQNKAEMNLSRLKTGSKIACVMYNDSWLTPNQFQHISGRGKDNIYVRHYLMNYPPCLMNYPPCLMNYPPCLMNYLNIYTIFRLHCKKCTTNLRAGGTLH